MKILSSRDQYLSSTTKYLLAIAKKLLKHYNILTKVNSYHLKNEHKRVDQYVQMLINDNIISLITDAGTPCISDPGAILIKECIKNNIDVNPVPGVSAASTAISISGYSERFFFYGFFPEKNKEISDNFTQLSNLDSAIVFFISSRKFNKSISIIKEYFYGRKILICREMSKLYEEFMRFEIDELEPFEKDLKGELTIVISQKNEKKASQVLSESDKRIIKKMINKFSTKEIINLINQNNKISKKIIYDFCIKLKKWESN